MIQSKIAFTSRPRGVGAGRLNFDRWSVSLIELLNMTKKLKEEYVTLSLTKGEPTNSELVEVDVKEDRHYCHISTSLIWQ